MAKFEIITKQDTSLPGPILITGVGGFVGAHLYSTLLKLRIDVFGVAHSKDSWRLDSLGIKSSVHFDLTDVNQLKKVLNEIKPATIFNLAAYGAYPHQTSPELTYAVNLGVVETLAQWCTVSGSILIQTGSSSEYGTNCSGPLETDKEEPNSRYAVSKLAATHLLAHLAATSSLAATVVRLYSVYGPLEDPTRLIPTLVREGLEGRLPEFSPEVITRDFVYIDDAVRYLIKVGEFLQKNRKFEIFNLATGEATSMSEVASSSKATFGIESAPKFVDNLRSWDLQNWFGNPNKIRTLVGWLHSETFASGLGKTADWYKKESNRSYLDKSLVADSGAQTGKTKMLSVIVACYRDELAIQEMYTRLKSVLGGRDLNYEIIFVNDCSPDNSLTVIQKISEGDSRVIGINHARNFGSQSAFLSGMSVALGDACVLMDGDLQDPPELIDDFLTKWGEGFEVVYGVRVSRDAPWYMRFAYKLFYRILSAVSPFKVPKDAGDFSLISRPVMDAMLAFPERDLFLRTSRAYSGHVQCGIDYVRPERPYGTSTNNFFKNVGWAIKGILSVSKKPLTYMSIAGFVLFILTTFALIVQVVLKIVAPESAPPGAVTSILLSMFFGAVNLLGISIVGEYVGRILDEVRGRPRFIVRSTTKNGKVSLNLKVDK